MTNAVNSHSVWSLLLLLLVASGCASEMDLLGTYASVSESEWEIYLELKGNGTALVCVETWETGEYNTRAIDTIIGDWEQSGAVVQLHYRNVVDTLTFDSLLSLEEIGIGGAAPGLEQRTTISSESIIGKHKLWKMPFTFYESPKDST